MQTFETAAIVSLVDELSGPLKALAKNAKNIVAELNRMNVGNAAGMDKYNKALRDSNKEAREHIGLLQKIGVTRRDLAVGLVFGTGRAAASAAHVVGDAVRDFAAYDIAQRFQAIVGKNNPSKPYTGAEVSALKQQRYALADKWGLKPEDTLDAQDVFVKRGKSADVTRGATEAAVVGAKALGVDAKTGGGILENWLFSSHIDLDTFEQARKESLNLADKMVRIAKSANVTAGDFSQAGIYGAGASYAAGISIDQQLALQGALKMSGVDGTQTGTLNRAIAGALIAPTLKGKMAITSLLDRVNKDTGTHYTYEDFYKPGGGLGADAIDQALRQRGTGKGLGAKGVEYFNKLVTDAAASDDPSKNPFASRAAFTAAVREALDHSGQKFDKGEAKGLARTSASMYDLEAGRSQLGVLRDLFIKAASQGEDIAMFGKKQAGRLLQANPERYFELLADVEASKGLATKIAKERSEGVGFELARLTANLDALKKSAVDSNAGIIDLTVGGLANFARWVQGQNAVTQGAVAAGAFGLTVMKDSIGPVIASAIGNTIVGGMIGRSIAKAMAAEAGVIGTAMAPAVLKGITSAETVASIAAAGGAAVGVTIVGVSAVAAGILAAAWLAKKFSDSDPNKGEAPSNFTAHERRQRLNAAIKHEADGYEARGPESVALAAAEATRVKREWEKANPRITEQSAIERAGWGENSTYREKPSDKKVVAELHGNLMTGIKLDVSPSAYFQTVIRKLEQYFDNHGKGDLGVTIQGSNATVPSKAIGVGHQ